MHYEDTIKAKVVPDRIYRYVDHNLRRHLEAVFDGRRIAVWGSQASAANRAKFERMTPGDEILIVEGGVIKALGKIAAKTVNRDLSRELWHNLRGGETGWDLIYFIANAIEIDLPFVEFCKLFGYADNYQLRGFTSIASDRLEEFYSRYDDLYSILMLRKQGLPVYEKAPEKDLTDEIDGQADVERVPVRPEDVDAVLTNGALSDHVKMQWKLIGLGLKCGSKVWIPAGDQKKIREQYHYDSFEQNFASGLDTQVRYIENIDVVWKEEYRIDAAFEIENSTAIYSGLLRFADLSLVAPNTIYPLFIVAPTEKRNRLIEQLKRPVFKHLNLDRKVRYLSYESIEEIDRFARNMERGLNIDVVSGKSEEIRLSA